jgi:hypothetical protein
MVRGDCARAAVAGVNQVGCQILNCPGIDASLQKPLLDGVRLRGTVSVVGVNFLLHTQFAEPSY